MRIRIEAPREECTAAVERLTEVLDVRAVSGPIVLRPQARPVVYAATLDAKLLP